MVSCQPNEAGARAAGAQGSSPMSGRNRPAEAGREAARSCVDFANGLGQGPCHRRATIPVAAAVDVVRRAAAEHWAVDDKTCRTHPPILTHARMQSAKPRRWPFTRRPTQTHEHRAEQFKDGGTNSVFQLSVERFASLQMCCGMRPASSDSVSTACGPPTRRTRIRHCTRGAPNGSCATGDPRPQRASQQASTSRNPRAALQATQLWGPRLQAIPSPSEGIQMIVVYTPKMLAPPQGVSPSTAKPEAVVRAWRATFGGLRLVEPAPVGRKELLRAHQERYVDDVLALRTPNGFGNRCPGLPPASPTPTVPCCRQHASPWTARPWSRPHARAFTMRAGASAMASARSTD